MEGVVPFGAAVWQWFVDSSTTAVVGWAGTVFGLLGLYLTYRQALDASQSAIAASNSSLKALQAVKRMEKLVSLADSAHIGAQIHMMEEAIARQDYSRLHLLFMTVRRGAEFVLLRGAGNESATEAVKRNLHVINTHISHANNDIAKFKATKITLALEGLSSSLIAIEHSIQKSESREQSS